MEEGNCLLNIFNKGLHKFIKTLVTLIFNEVLKLAKSLVFGLLTFCLLQYLAIVSCEGQSLHMLQAWS